MPRFLKVSATAATALVLGAGAASAQVVTDAGAVSNTIFVLLSGFLVMWMAAGFTMLEAGFVRSRNVTMQLAKNVGLFSISGITFALVGYALSNPGGLWIVDGLLSGQAPGTTGIEPYGSTAMRGSHAGGANFFIQMMFCVTTASIVSGAVAERVRLMPFLVFVVFLTALIYPIQASWSWGGGFLDALGFTDHAGSVVVHTVGGWAALAGIVILGARVGKFENGRVRPMPGSNLPLSTLGIFALWLGWFGFNAGSALGDGTAADFINAGRIVVNTNAAASGGAIAAIVLTQAIFRKVDLTMVLNGTLAGLVSITAEPAAPSILVATLIGAGGGAVVVVLVPLLDRLGLDDVVGAVPVHLGAGIWGGLIAGFTAPDGSMLAQFVGIAVVGAFAFTASILFWFLLRVVMGLRFDPATEREGLDISELGMEAYPDFVTYEDGP